MPDCCWCEHCLKVLFFDSLISVMDWRALFSQQLEKVHQHYTPKLDVEISDLADMLSTFIEGGIVVSRALCDKKLLVRQLLEYRNYIWLLYEA